MKVLTTAGLTKLIQLIKSSFISNTDTVTAQTVTLADVATSGDYNDLSNKPTIPTVNDATLTIQKNGTTVNTFTANASSNVTANITVPTDTNDLTNGAGYITSSALTNYATTNTAQDISGRKTFLGEKAIYFKQSATTNKLGFTLYNPSSTELGAFEWRPSTIGSGALLNINVPYSSSNYVGFRYWGTAVNIVAPKVATAGDYYIPTHITNGNTTVTASNNGTVNISTLLPTIPTVDQTFDGTSTNAQSGVAIAGANFVQNTATGTNALTISGTATTYNSGVNIGYGSSATTNGTSLGVNAAATANSISMGYGSNAGGGKSIALGANAKAYSTGAVAIGNGVNAENTNVIAIGNLAYAYGANTIALGYQANAMANGALQIGTGTNSTANTLQVGSYTLLDTSTGLIPDACISSNIARVGDIPTVPTNISAFTNDSGYITSSALNGYATETWVGQQGYITGITSSDVITALTYTPTDTDLSNLSSTGKTVIDGQWVGNSTTVVEGLQLNTSTNISYTLPVPNDGYKYEALLTCTVTSTATSGQQTAIYLSSTEMPYTQCVARAMPRSAASVTAGGSIIIPIGTDRKLTVVRTTTFYGTGYIYLRGYRRIGSNT